MTTYGWWAVLDSKEVGTKPLGAKRFGREMVFWRNPKGEVIAQSDLCPHRGARLSSGSVVDGCIQCPFHGFLFAEDGACTKVPAHPERRIPRSLKTKTWAVREAHGFVWMWVDETCEPASDLRFFEDLDETWSVGGFEKTWNTHFTRCVENQLDYTHIAFVHEKTIGRFAGELVDFEVASNLDEATEGAAPEPAWIRFGESAGPDAGIEWREPNIWINRITPTMQITVAFVPVDDTTTKLYLRNWQKQVTLPGLAWLWQQLSGWLNRKILEEDRAVVEDQLPRIARLESDERLVPSDRPILLYRKLLARRRSGPTRDPSVGDADADRPAA